MTVVAAAIKNALTALLSSIFYIIINIFFTIGVSGISIGGHFGGLIAGALCGFLIVFAERRVRRPVELEVLGMTALAVLSVVGAIAVA